MTELTDWIEQTLHLPFIIQKKILQSIVVLIILYIIRRLVSKFLVPKSQDIKTVYTWRRTSYYITSGIGIIVIAIIWLHEIQSLSTFFGLLTAGLAIALREPIVNFFGWLFIIFRTPFEMSDRIQMDNFKGDVLGISTMEFTLMEIGNWVDAEQSTGRIIHVPNGRIFNTPVFNYTQAFGYLWNELPLTITFESDWKKARTVLEKITTEVAATFGPEHQGKLRKVNRHISIQYTTLTPIVYMTVVENGIRFTIRYLCDPRGKRGSSQKIWETILLTFDEHDDIQLAYPTTRIRLGENGGNNPFPEKPTSSN